MTIVVDTAVLAYASGGEHPLRPPSRRFDEAIERGELSATTSVEVIQELAHHKARRVDRASAVRLAREGATYLSPLLSTVKEDLDVGLGHFEEIEGLGSFHAVLAALALRHDGSLVSPDKAFAKVPGLRHLDPASATFLADLNLA